MCNYCEHKTGDGSSVCDKCYESKVKPMNSKPGMAGMIQKEYLRNYGMVENSRLRALDSRRILPYDRPGGGYYVGTYERGKIREKEPDY